MLEPVADAEAVAQRRREQAGAGRRADEGEWRQVEGHRPRSGALPEHDRQAPVLVLRWPQDGPAERLWELPEGLCVVGAPPGLLGVFPRSSKG